MIQPRLALKVDCDTFEGTQKGIPNLLRLFDEFHIKASFFFTLGPDTSGRAAFRVFTQKGFLKKMLRSNAAALYGPKTMLYGTLLPSPMIGEKCADIIRSVGHGGHDIGVHAWDHIRWHDKVDRIGIKRVEEDYRNAHQTFEHIFGKKAQSSAAPGWHACLDSLLTQDKYNLLYTSDTRGGPPCFIRIGDKTFNTLEIPSTLPTWDEALCEPQFKDKSNLINHFTQAIKGTEVHSIHTEVEGTAHLDLFRKQIEAWKSNGVAFLTLAQLAKEQLANRSKIPTRNLKRIEIPNRAGLISSTI